MAGLTISAVEIFRLDVRNQRPFRIALGVLEAATNLLVRVHASDGTYGMGEAAPIWYIAGETQATDVAAARTLAQLLLNRDPLDIETRLRELDAFLVGNTTVKSAFDMALHDLAGKHAGLPLYALFGGPRRSFEIDLTIGIDTPEIMGREALDIQARGFSAIKVKLGTGHAEDVARIRAIRAAVGAAIPLRIDANQGWDPVTALAILRDLAPYGIQYCEQPVAHWNTAGLKHLRDHSPIPIMADEALFSPHDAFRLASQGACDYFNIKLAKSGGLHAALEINAIAEAAGIPCMMGSMAETRLGLTAAAHLVSARPNIAFANLDTHFFHAEDPVIGGVTCAQGWMSVPEAPGLGADIRPEVLRTLAKETIC
jgi:L-alanine-DL-glutamate epimerase-like enolase superfamily enzyme